MSSRNFSNFNFYRGKFQFLPVTLSSPTATLKTVKSRVPLKARLELKQVTKQLRKIKMRTTSRRLGLKWLLKELLSTWPSSQYPLQDPRLLGETMWNRPVLCALTVRHYTNLQSAETGMRKKTKSASSWTIEALDNTWGLRPNSSIPVFHTKIGGFYAIHTTPTTTITATITVGLEGRESPRLCRGSLSPIASRSYRQLEWGWEGVR
ncbi:hypothetical protein NEUTE1DRAFT_128312 [Neurospora tetrasperma FGSC 2508]|uniref:Uncharacterized protein n=1 Tax=Neurospora tetrasperma (strain FGSC 2508 / ATCC MYA-4615 / P0657) TaxID=510951 RepID=F8MH91_NEUT8|nr:uncharacterized protein NEUTE1DRAFT_128312 [Neurospora tetrasperma FGSC 2508]EGO58756.1 hypothetical protein NEUTE1DRAFT_128312 [Neurospora tetrasperma FGSC 2508]EGZ72849.1 hypothetical protein NEUTE2DRAFT_106735 [Neurospora tetrasperma FGSC 2509]